MRSLEARKLSLGDAKLRGNLDFEARKGVSSNDSTSDRALEVIYAA